jgi:hypothetical protein
MKAFFLSRQFREKVLLVAFILLGATLWASSVLRRSSNAAREVQQTSANLREQQLWLERREQIEQAAAAAISNLDSSRTFSDLRLSAELSAIANATGVGGNARSAPGRTERTPQMAMHTLEFELQRVEWKQLYTFYQALSKRAPYINIERCSVTADRSGNLLNAALLVSSVEIAR